MKRCLLKKMLAVAIPAVLGVVMSAGAAAAADAYLYIKGKMEPLYIQNIKFYYYNDRVSQETAIVIIKEQGKYHGMPFTELREIKFDKLVGNRNMKPVFKVEVQNQDGGVHIDGMLMPLRKISGSYQGRSWDFNLMLDQGYEQNADNLQAVKFMRWNK